MKKNYYLPIAAGVLSLCTVAASAISPSHSKSHFLLQGASAVLYAAYSEDGEMIGCRWNSLDNQWQATDWTVPDAAEYKEIPVTANFLPVDIHNHSDISYDWSETEEGRFCTATAKCSGCETVYATETVPVVLIGSAEPTCTAGGYRTYTASFTNALFEDQEETELLDPVHTYEWKFINPGNMVHKCASCSAQDDQITFSGYSNYDYKKYTSKTQAEQLKIRSDFGEYFDLWFNYLKSQVDPTVIED